MASQTMNKSTDARETFIPPHGGYAGLLAYQKALVVFQGTVRFCARFFEKRDRTVDQMTQAAPIGEAKHYRRKQGLRYLQGNGNQANRGGSGEP
jgi:hypothetical protein